MADTTESSAERTESKETIIVNLLPRGPSSIPQRRLVLTRSHPTVRIGRSSQVQSKGLIPAEDNAWFDNPVMSREHAKIVVSFDDKPPSVYIIDTNSFHGTFHTMNDGRDEEQRVIRYCQAKIANGDSLRFGNDIFRANKTYPPCSVNILIEDVTQKMDASPRRAFTVPDYVDEEEDEEGEDEAGHGRLTQYQHATDRVGFPNLATKSPATLIDLTSISHESDEQRSTTHPRAPCPPSQANVHSLDSPYTGSPDCVLLTDIIAKPPTNPTANRNVSPDFVDLTSEMDGESDAEESDARPCARPSSAKAEVHPPHTPSSKSSSSSEPTIQTTDKTIPTTFTPSMALDDEDKHISESDSDDEKSNEDAESEFSHDSELESEASLELTDEMSETSETSETSEVSEDFDMQNQLPLYQTFDDVLRGPGLSKAFRAGSSDDSESLSGSSVGSQPGSVDDSYFDREEEGEHNMVTESADHHPRINAAPPVMLMPKQMDNEATTAPVASGICHHPRARPWELKTPNRTHHRDPSPSDAALFMRRNSPEARAWELGERTAPSPAIGDAPSNVQPQGDNSAEPGPGSPRSCGPITTATTTETHDKVPKPDLFDLEVFFSDGDPMSSQSIENPLSPSRAQRQPDDIDLANAPDGRDMLLMAAMGHTPRRLPIQYLLAHEPNQSSLDDQPTTRIHGQAIKDCAPAPIKRSHDVAFGEGEDDAVCKDAENVMTSSAAEIIETEGQDQPPHDKVDVRGGQGHLVVDEVTDLEEQVLPTHEPAATSVEPNAPRPTKRARIATATAQVVVCVALGGAATFSYLINTAPVF